ncbi:MAG: hypothetical protein AAF627_21845 [Myxococcota bacterium]
MQTGLAIRFFGLCLLGLLGLGCQESPAGLGTGRGDSDAAVPDVGGLSPEDVGPAELGAADSGAPKPTLPSIDEPISLQLTFVDYRRLGDPSVLPDEIRDVLPFADHSIRVDVRPMLPGGDLGGLLVHPPFGPPSGPYFAQEDDGVREILFASQVCATCISAVASVQDSRFLVTGLALRTVVDEDGVRRWSGNGRITGIETYERRPATIEADAALDVRVDDIRPNARIETVPSVLLPFAGATLRFSEPILDEGTPIEVDTRDGLAFLDVQSNPYLLDVPNAQFLGYAFSTSTPWPSGQIEVRTALPPIDLSGNRGSVEALVIPVLRDPRSSVRVDFENRRSQDWEAWGPHTRWSDADRCIGSACLAFEIGDADDSGLLTRLGPGSPLRAIDYRLRLLSSRCGAGVDVSAIALPWGETRPFAARQSQNLRTGSTPVQGICDSGWVEFEAALPEVATEAWLSIELRWDQDRDPSLILLVDEIAPRPALTND